MSSMKRKQESDEDLLLDENPPLRPTYSLDERVLLDFEESEELDSAQQQQQQQAVEQGEEKARSEPEVSAEDPAPAVEREEEPRQRSKFDDGERKAAEEAAEAAISSGPTPSRKRFAADDGTGSAKGTPASQRLTRQRLFVHEFECLDGTLFSEVMNEVSRDFWKQISVESAGRMRSGRLDLVLADGPPAGRRDMNALLCRLKCRIDAPVITNKVTLQLLLNRNEPTLALEGYAIQKSGSPPRITDGEAWLFRPEGGKASAHIVLSNAQLREAVDKHREDPKAKRAVLSRYMLNPLLIDGRKAVLRVYFIASVNRTHVKTWVLRDGLFGVAPKAFVAGEYDDMSVHNTRLWNSPYSFPRDYPGGPEAAAGVFEKVVSSLRRLSALAAPRFRHYEESEMGFELFGCDFLVDATGNAFLSNFRSKPGFPVHYKELRDEEAKKQQAAADGEKDDAAAAAAKVVEEGEVASADVPTSNLSSDDLAVVSRYIYRNLRDLVLLPFFDRTPAESADAVLLHDGELDADL